jgi:hypothetical protein
MTTFNTSMTVGELIEVLAEGPVLDDAPRDQLRELLVKILDQAAKFYEYPCGDFVPMQALGLASLALTDTVSETASFMVEGMEGLALAILVELEDGDDWELDSETSARLEQIQGHQPAKNEDRQTETV